MVSLQKEEGELGPKTHHNYPQGSCQDGPGVSLECRCSSW